MKNSRGFGIVELAAWIIVVSFFTKGIAAVMRADAGPANKIDLAAYHEIHQSLSKSNDAPKWTIY